MALPMASWPPIELAFATIFLRSRNAPGRRRIHAEGAGLPSRIDGDIQLTGRVNRVTKRATVLVTDPDGKLYSDGLRYRTSYVPLACLRSVMAHRDRSSTPIRRPAN